MVWEVRMLSKKAQAAVKVKGVLGRNGARSTAPLPLSAESSRAFKGDFYRGARYLVLGATGGLGQALSYALAYAGAGALFLTGRNGSVLSGLCAALQARGVNCESRVCDVTSLSSLHAVLQEAIAWGVEGIFIAFGVAVPMTEDGLEEPEDVAKCMAVNLVAVGAVLNDVARLKCEFSLNVKEGFKENGAMGNASYSKVRAEPRPFFVSVVTSQAALMPLPFAPAYSASKAGVSALCEAMRERLHKEGIHLTVVMPGFFDSAMGEQFVGLKHGVLSAEEVAQRMLRTTATGRKRVSFPVWQGFALFMGRVLPHALVKRVLPLFAFRTRERGKERD